LSLDLVKKNRYFRRAYDIKVTVNSVLLFHMKTVAGQVFETSWYKNLKTMDNFQNTGHSFYKMPSAESCKVEVLTPSVFVPTLGSLVLP
jgi:hypothetical protein